MFGYTIIKKSELNRLWEIEDGYRRYLRFEKEEPTLNCGYKSCSFQTTSPAGLKRHRTVIHRKK